eukprot:1330406-Pyramimonas_sp.AAC.1
MGDYGAMTIKPTWVYSNKQVIKDILNYKIDPGERLAGNLKTKPEMVKTWTGTDGKTKAYPRGFGEAVAKLLDKNAGELQSDAL